MHWRNKICTSLWEYYWFYCSMQGRQGYRKYDSETSWDHDALKFPISCLCFNSVEIIVQTWMAEMCCQLLLWMLWGKQRKSILPMEINSKSKPAKNQTWASLQNFSTENTGKFECRVWYSHKIDTHSPFFFCWLWRRSAEHRGVCYYPHGEIPLQ